MPRVKQRHARAATARPSGRGRDLASEGVAGFTTRRVATRRGHLGPCGLRDVRRQGRTRPRGLLRGLSPPPATLRRDRGVDTTACRSHAVIGVFRAFVCANPVLAEVMFSRPFADFDPGPEERRPDPTSGVHRRPSPTVHRRGGLRRRRNRHRPRAGGSHPGPRRQETAGWLGTSQASVDRRWELAVTIMLDGLGSL